MGLFREGKTNVFLLAFGPPRFWAGMLVVGGIEPAWLTEALYSLNSQPLLARMSTSTIALKIRVSRWYAGCIRKGHRPHARHWRALAQLVGICMVCKAGYQLAKCAPHGT